MPPQLERDCQPFYSAGFNAFNLVELALVTSPRFLTVGEQRGWLHRGGQRHCSGRDSCCM